MNVYNVVAELPSFLKYKSNNMSLGPGKKPKKGYSAISVVFFCSVDFFQEFYSFRSLFKYLIHFERFLYGENKVPILFSHDRWIFSCSKIVLSFFIC